jgi:integrase
VRELSARTRDEYRKKLKRHLIPEFCARLNAITDGHVENWYGRMRGHGATQAHCYALLRVILNTARKKRAYCITENPCQIDGGGIVKGRQRRTDKMPSLAELGAILLHLRAEDRLAVLFGAWLSMRIGEIAELRRKGVHLDAGEVSITRAVGVATNPSTGRSEFVVGDPKGGGVREVAIPPHLIPLVAEHLACHTAPGKEVLLFPAPTRFADGSQKWLRSNGALHRDFHRVRTEVGPDSTHVHDLRHFGATLAAQSGATIAELMHRLGHSTQRAAMIYQHGTKHRDWMIADAMSAHATGKVVDLSAKHARARA